MNDRSPHLCWLILFFMPQPCVAGESNAYSAHLFWCLNKSTIAFLFSFPFTLHHQHYPFSTLIAYYFFFSPITRTHTHTHTQTTIMTTTKIIMQADIPSDHTARFDTTSTLEPTSPSSPHSLPSGLHALYVILFDEMCFVNGLVVIILLNFFVSYLDPRLTTPLSYV